MPSTPEPYTMHPELQTRYPKPETRKPKPETRNLKPETQNPKPEPRNAIPGGGLPNRPGASPRADGPVVLHQVSITSERRGINSNGFQDFVSRPRPEFGFDCLACAIFVPPWTILHPARCGYLVFEVNVLWTPHNLASVCPLSAQIPDR